MSQRILVAGGGGVLAGPLINRLRRDFPGAEILAVDIKPVDEWVTVPAGAITLVGDLRSRDLARSVCRGASAVFDLAGEVGNILHIRSERLRCYHAAEIHLALLEASTEAGVQQFFFASTACVYPQSLLEPGVKDALAESDAMPADPEPGYGWEKLFIEQVCQQYRDDGLLATTIGRMHNIFGPPSTFTGGKEKAPAALCRKVIEAKRDGSESIEVWGDGSQKRTYLFIDDAIDAIMAIFEHDIPEPLNIGSDRKVSVDELVSVIEGLAGVRLERLYQGAGLAAGVPDRGCDLTKVSALTSWRPATSLERGLELNYRWIEEQLTGEGNG